MTVSATRLTDTRYWHPPSSAIDADEDENVDRLDALIRDSVRLRLLGDVPVGSFLSGGLDSSLVDDLTVECRHSDEFFVKAATSLRYQLRDIRRLQSDLELLRRFGWRWRGQSVDCAYDEDEDAWDARVRVMTGVTRNFALEPILSAVDAGPPVAAPAIHRLRPMNLTPG